MGAIDGDDVGDLWRFEREVRSAGRERVAGVDEAGRGPLAGPVVAAAIMLPFDFDLNGIRDSKSLSPLQRESAYARIIAGAVAVGVGIVGPEIIDKINILQATFEAMRAALVDMGATFDFVLVDGNRIMPGIDADEMAIVEGDKQSASIAAASIVAKVVRDRMMTELALAFPGYGFEKHKGYCTEEHLRAIDERGICSVHRKSFSPVARKVNEDCLQQGLF